MGKMEFVDMVRIRSLMMGILRGNLINKGAGEDGMPFM